MCHADKQNEHNLTSVHGYYNNLSIYVHHIRSRTHSFTMDRQVQYDARLNILYVNVHLPPLTKQNFVELLRPYRSCQSVVFQSDITIEEFAFSDPVICKTRVQQITFNGQTFVDDLSFVGATIRSFVFNCQHDLNSPIMFTGNDVVEQVTLPAISVIPNNMFANCSKLCMVVGHFKSIGHHAFYGCSNLRLISLLYARHIGEYAFCQSGIRDVRIHSHDTVTIHSHAFFDAAIKYVELACNPMFYGSHHFSKSDVNKVDIVCMGGNQEEYSTEHSDRGRLSQHCFADCAFLTHVTIDKRPLVADAQAHYMHLPRAAFINCTRLQQLKFGRTHYRLATIGVDALANCPQVNIQPLLWCNNVEAYACAGTSCNLAFRATHTMEYIASHAFFRAKLTMLKLSQSIKCIGNNAFKEATIGHLYIGMSALSSVPPDEPPMNPNDDVFKHANISNLYIEPLMTLSNIDNLITNLKDATLTTVHCTPSFRSRWPNGRNAINWVLYDSIVAVGIHAAVFESVRSYVPDIDSNVDTRDLDIRTKDEIEHDRNVWTTTMDWNRDDIPTLEYTPRSP